MKNPLCDELLKGFPCRRRLCPLARERLFQPVTSRRAERTSGPEKFRWSVKKDFFNTICRYRKLVIRTNDLAEVASLDGTASLHFVE
jgi:hypothetical protein